jgi:hypothetical protein
VLWCVILFPFVLSFVHCGTVSSSEYPSWPSMSMDCSSSFNSFSMFVSRAAIDGDESFISTSVALAVSCISSLLVSLESLLSSTSTIRIGGKSCRRALSTHGRTVDLFPKMCLLAIFPLFQTSRRFVSMHWRQIPWNVVGSCGSRLISFGSETGT